MRIPVCVSLAIQRHSDIALSRFARDGSWLLLVGSRVEAKHAKSPNGGSIKSNLISLTRHAKSEGWMILLTF
jgi:hypothetical protein